ncbi:glycoside hydrolase family 88 protein [Echinicola marina]|uniref:glycoside hydrolase family 88/105 protein n=1 Tax=Echinicola marina TaxID=2859768 RepID=UPI001CF7122F|nr:glycoside hydrolase family 88 protein [Echinicola marina]UCS94990.1 glycoside hydrolase family 88 protein [Echinicola marina]
MKKLSLLLIMAIFFSQSTFGQSGQIDEDLDWSERMALSVMKRNPEAWQVDFMDRAVWSYPQGLMLHAFEELWKKTDNNTYYNYIQAYADKLIEEDGQIKTYKYETYNIDMINSGKLLFNLYAKTGDERYKKAIGILRGQLKYQPKTSEGGFWHKLRYTNQMWLDGAYMGTPFLMQYAKEFNQPKDFDEAVLQLELMEKHLRDPKTGLLYHGWDESRFQAWADPETGRSPNVWGRAMGWYAMAVVDALDFLPEEHYGKVVLKGILQRLASAVSRYQDKESGLWYQVVDQGAREGNYLEASVSSMFVYALAKGVNEGHLDKVYWKTAEKGFEGIISELIEVKDDGELNLTQVCAVAGLGGKPYRDGSYEYYVNEKIRTNDPKGVGPFILAAMELGW